MEIKDFLNYLEYERNYSAKTIESYGDDLAAFLSYFKGIDSHLSWESVDSDVIRDWMGSMMDRGNNATSINRRLSALRSFFRFALSQGLVQRDPAYGVKGPKANKPLPVFMRESDMDKLADERAWNMSLYKDVCAYTIIMVFYETGLRVSELVSLNDVQVDMVNSQLRVVGKRDKERIVPFGADLKSILQRFFDCRDAQVARESEALFVTGKGIRMTHMQVRYIVKKCLSRVSAQKKLTPHVLRHTFATAMLNHEAGLEGVRRLMGHASLGTTQVYTHTTFENMKKVYKSAHPRTQQP